MQAISNAIKEGARKHSCAASTGLSILAQHHVLAVILFVGYKIGRGVQPAVRRQNVIAFFAGSLACSALAGFTGMYVSIRTNIRTASAAQTSLNRAMQLDLRGGAVTGLVVVSLYLFAGSRLVVPAVWRPEIAPRQRAKCRSKLSGSGLGGIFRGAICPVGWRNLYQGR